MPPENTKVFDICKFNFHYGRKRASPKKPSIFNILGLIINPKKRMRYKMRQRHLSSAPILLS